MLDVLYELYHLTEFRPARDEDYDFSAPVAAMNFGDFLSTTRNATVV